MNMRLGKHGLSREGFDLLWDQQNGRCAICRVALVFGKRGVHVDHDHLTNKVRGLLCAPCNVGLGQFGDSPELLRAALDYLLEEDKVHEYRK